MALNPIDESNLISMDGKGTPNSGQIICKFGQLAWYWRRKLRRSVILRSKTDWRGWSISGAGIVAWSACDRSWSALHKQPFIEDRRVVRTQRLICDLRKGMLEF